MLIYTYHIGLLLTPFFLQWGQQKSEREREIYIIGDESEESEHEEEYFVLPEFLPGDDFGWIALRR